MDEDTIERIKALPMLVIEQDGAACELNQQGIKSKSFEHGILVAQEYELWNFHEWLRARLGTAGQPAEDGRPLDARRNALTSA